MVSGHENGGQNHIQKTFLRWIDISRCVIVKGYGSEDNKGSSIRITRRISKLSIHGAP